jgi:hypothetical protein
MHDEHIAMGSVGDRPADVTVQQPIDEPGLVRADDDEVHVVLLGEVDDRVRRVAMREDALGLEASGGQQFARMLKFLGVALR